MTPWWGILGYRPLVDGVDHRSEFSACFTESHPGQVGVVVMDGASERCIVTTSFGDGRVCPDNVAASLIASGRAAMFESKHATFELWYELRWHWHLNLLSHRVGAEVRVSQTR